MRTLRLAEPTPSPYPRESAGFTPMRDEIARAGVPVFAMLVYERIVRYHRGNEAGEPVVTLTQALLARALGASRDRVGDALRRLAGPLPCPWCLRSHPYIHITRHGKRQPNTYRLFSSCEDIPEELVTTPAKRTARPRSTAKQVSMPLPPAEVTPSATATSHELQPAPQSYEDELPPTSGFEGLMRLALRTPPTSEVVVRRLFARLITALRQQGHDAEQAETLLSVLVTRDDVLAANNPLGFLTHVITSKSINGAGIEKYQRTFARFPAAVQNKALTIVRNHLSGEALDYAGLATLGIGWGKATSPPAPMIVWLLAHAKVMAV